MVEFINFRLVDHLCLVDNVQGQDRVPVLVHATLLHQTQDQMSMIVLSAKSCIACPEISALQEERLMIDLVFKLKKESLFCI